MNRRDRGSFLCSFAPFPAYFPLYWAYCLCLNPRGENSSLHVDTLRMSLMNWIFDAMFGTCSCRWLVTKSRQEEAVRILRVAAVRNGLDPLITFPNGTFLVDNEQEEEDSGTIWDLFSPKWLRITMLLWGVWFGLAFLYYGVIIAVTIVFTVHLEDDDDQEGSYDFDYGAIFISASAEVVGLIIVMFTIDTYGRIKTQAFFYLVGGGACLIFLLAASTNASRLILLILSFMSRMAMMG